MLVILFYLREYRDYTHSINHKKTLAHLVEINMVYFDVILGMVWFRACYFIFSCFKFSIVRI